jgi:hypothetical protein
MSGKLGPTRARDAEQAAAEDDQRASEVDQAGSDADQAASDADQRNAERDQAAADQDQAQADRDLAALVDVSASQKRDYDTSRAERQAHSVARAETRENRAQSAMARAVAAGKRDRIADDRETLRHGRGLTIPGRIGLREPGFFRWAWRHISTGLPNLRPGQANLVIEADAQTERVIARLIVEKRGLDVQASGHDPVEAVENLVRVLR